MVLFSCNKDKVVEIELSDEPIQNSLFVMSELVATFDAIDDLVSVDSLMQEKGDPFISPDVNVFFIDSLFTDGDGVEAIFDFGPDQGHPRGELCKDGHYRAGRMHAYLSAPYDEVGAELVIDFKPEYNYVSGNGVDMVDFSGQVTLKRLSPNTIHCTSYSLTSFYSELAQDITASLAVSKILDGGLGLRDDVISIAGEVVLVGPNQTIGMATQNPLKKMFTSNCAGNIIAGEISSIKATSPSEFFVDFDPYEDEACDNLAAITLNGKTVIHEF